MDDVDCSRLTLNTIRKQEMKSLLTAKVNLPC